MPVRVACPAWSGQGESPAILFREVGFVKGLFRTNRGYSEAGRPTKTGLAGVARRDYEVVDGLLNLYTVVIRNRSSEPSASAGSGPAKRQDFQP